MSDNNKIKELIEDASEIIKNVGEDAKDIYEKAQEKTKVWIDQAQKDVNEFVDQTQQDISDFIDEKKQEYKDFQEDLEMKKLQPIFAVADINENPGLICIDDIDEKHRDSDVCKGSMGNFVNPKKGIRTLVLYKKDLKSNDKYSFYPSDGYGMYYPSPINSNLYIGLDDYFKFIKDQTVAELMNIASKIGAKHAMVKSSVEEETIVSNQLKQKGKAKGKIKKVKGSIKEELENEKNEEKKATEYIEDSADWTNTTPVEPELHYFKNDDRIKGLIDDALKGKAQSRKFIIKYSEHAFLDKNTALKIDSTLGYFDFAGNTSFTSKVETQYRSNLEFYIEF